MAVTTVGSFPGIGVKVMEEGAPATGDNTFTHGLPYTPKVYAVVSVSATSGAKTVEVKSEGATTVVVAVTTAAPDKIRVVLGP